ncbi:MAG: TetR/AcrR family transcriptional regulator [Desulfobacterales bacterium]|nr:TetR/AcrR family transcriptional regulator [Desulfobacterales bacterium]
MLYKEFKKNMTLSLEAICLDIFNDDENSIKIKNQKIGVKKLGKIIDAALKLSNEKGFHAMSLRELCKESGLSMGGLYAYIESKDELLNVIQDHGRRILLKTMTENLTNINDPLEKLEAAIRLHLYLSEMMQAWFFFSYMETRFFNKEEKKTAKNSELFTEKIFHDILNEGCFHGVFTLEDPLLTASVLKAMLQDWYLKRWKYQERDISVEKYAEVIISWIKAFAGVKLDN